MQELLGGHNKERNERVTGAVLKMKKVEIAEIKRASQADLLFRFYTCNRTSACS